MKIFLKNIQNYEQVYRENPKMLRLLKSDVKRYSNMNVSRYYNINDLASLLSNEVTQSETKIGDGSDSNKKKKSSSKEPAF